MLRLRYEPKKSNGDKMSTKITISIADAVYEQITITQQGENRSEHVEELIRDGFKHRELLKGGSNAI